MNFKTTIGLVVLLAVLGGFLYYLERTEPPVDTTATDQGEPGQGQPVFKEGDFSPDAIDSVTLESDGQTVLMQRKGPDWNQTQPVEFALNDYSVKQIIDAVAALRYTSRFTPGQKDFPPLTELGLAPARASLTLASGGAKPVSHTVNLGRTLVGGKAYVMIDQDLHAYVVDDALQQQIFDKKVWDLRRKSLTSPSESQADSVTLARQTDSGPENVTVVKSDSTWSLSPPHSGRADTSAVAGLLSGVGGITIAEFAADAPADLSIYGLDKPRITLTVRVPTAPPAAPAASQPNKNSAPAATSVRVLRIGGATDLNKQRYYATWSDQGDMKPVVFVISKADARNFEKTVDDLRDARITPLKDSEVRQVTLAPAAGTPIRLERTPASGWAFIKDAHGVPAFAADDGQVTALVDNITQTKAVGYVADYAGNGAPAAVVTLDAVGKAQPDVLRLFVPADKTRVEFIVLRNNETTGYRVPAGRLADVFDSALALRDRQVVKLDPDRLTKIEVRKPGDPVMVFTRTVGSKPATQPTVTVTTEPSESSKPGPWRLNGQAKFEDRDLAILIDQATDLRAEGWITLPGAKPGPESDTVILTPAEGAPVTLRIDPETRIATASGVGEPFTAGEPLATEADAEFRDRTVLNLPHDQIKRLTISSHGRSMVLEVDEENQYVSPTVKEKINQSIAGGIFDAVAGLRAMRFVAPRLPATGPASEPAPLMSVEILDKKNNKHSIDIYGPDRMGFTAHMDGQWFTLDPRVVKKLQDDPTAPPPPPPPPRAPMQGYPPVN